MEWLKKIKSIKFKTDNKVDASGFACLINEESDEIAVILGKYGVLISIEFKEESVKKENGIG